LPAHHPRRRHRLGHRGASRDARSRNSVSRAGTAKVAALLLSILATLGPSQVAEAAEPESKEDAAKSQGPEVNPYECYGGYQAATENRTIGEIRHELSQRLVWLNDQMPPTIRAVKLCIVAKLKARVG